MSEGAQRKVVGEVSGGRVEGIRKGQKWDLNS